MHPGGAGSRATSNDAGADVAGGLVFTGGGGAAGCVIPPTGGGGGGGA